jgi:hypothetical protein
MSKLFVTDKELHLINSITKELVQKVVDQKILYYSVSEEHTKTNDLYNESIRKVVYEPVELNARVLLLPPENTTTNFTSDLIFRIEVYFHLDELYQRNLTPRQGDFIKWNKIVYEIQTLTSPQITFGQIEQEVMLKAVCQSTRKSNLDVKDG